MPILRVTAIGVDEAAVAHLAQPIADATAPILVPDQPAGRVWVTVQAIPRARYAENGCELPADARPIWVEILMKSPPAGDAMDRQVAELTRVLASATARPEESIHVIYETPGSGRVAFGGRVVR